MASCSDLPGLAAPRSARPAIEIAAGPGCPGCPEAPEAAFLPASTPSSSMSSLDDVDVDSFLHLSGDHYYTYPALVRERAAAIRTGKLTVEGA